MKAILRILCHLALALTAAGAQAQSLPWKFGATPDEVKAVSRYGPYQAFANGDLETYRGLLDGRERNFQFFFDHGALRRIGVYLYEGTDAHLAAQAWLSLHEYLARTYGAVETPGNVSPVARGDASKAEFVANAIALVGAKGKTQMAPVDQPKDAAVFSSFLAGDVNGERWYYIVLYFVERDS